MRRVWPHEFFRLDFDQMLEEGKRQKQIDTANAGEYNLVRSMHAYFESEVLPAIVNDDWVYEAASTFASDYAMDCFDCLKLDGQEVYNTQKNLLALNEKVADFLGRAYLAGAAPLAGTIDLPKASDFLDLIQIGRLSPGMRSEAEILHEQAKDHEFLQLKVTLRGIRAAYEMPLPRVMYVVRRAMKVKLDLPPRPSDDKLTGMSEYISWYTARVSSGHPLYPVLGQLHAFYKVARDVGSHHRGLKWKPETDEVILPDNKTVLTIPLREFQQKFRHIVYVCEIGLRGILSAFCERERGSVSNWLVKEYLKTFPEDFPEGEPGTVAFYPV